ncbi:MAG TPA: biotin/lipoate A/B protein ligase family protein [Candidatus Aminicenantes bacterium]|nr:biotin/lipoate A/B protein ligase family protein [Candidatus Aminicenantes bacterium]HRY66359.1 biotin/lipoate A/B protein ligase family protein [Candidatus Aminicenantes bacterium]HRZ73289.1 biotin/lipoate A/B protein ligase family protein [Candidatus Aminicenantes bacterium]
MKTWSLIIEPAPLPGSRNMAVDERLYDLARDSGRTYLRFYRWLRPTASLGYSQDAARVVDAEFCRAHGIDIVRRMTGGKLVLHDREVTYSMASADASVFTETLRDSYRLISQALLAGLALLGVSARLAESSPPGYAKGTMPCFAFPARDEIEIGGRKIVGSAQKRTGPLFLQHGSIILDKDEALLAAVSRPGEAPESLGMTSLSEALGRPVDFEAAVGPLVQGFADRFGVAFEPISLAPADLDAVRAIEADRYAAETWTFRRRPASR